MMVDEGDMLTKASERYVGASDKATRGIGSGRDLLAVKIARRRTRVNIERLA